MRRVALSSTVALLAIASACGKSSDGRQPDAAPGDPAATSSAEPPPSPSAHAVAAAPPASGSPVVPSGVGSASSARAAEGRRGRPTSSSSASNAPAAHPLAEWMRGPATTALESGDLESIASAFERMAAWAPPGYPNWSSIAVDGSEAARVGSMEAVKAACRGCHRQYEARYKAEQATRPLS